MTLAQVVLQQRAAAAPLFTDIEGVFPQLAQFAAPLGQVESVSADEDQFIVRQGIGGKLFEIHPAAVLDNRQLDMPFAQLDHGLFGNMKQQLDVGDLVIAQHEAVQCLGELNRAEGGGAAHAQRVAVFEVFQLLHHLVFESEDFVRFLKGDFSCIGEQQTGAGAVEQLAPEMILQPFDPLRDCGLGNVELLGGLGEAACLSDHRQCSQITCFHERSYEICCL